MTQSRFPLYSPSTGAQNLRVGIPDYVGVCAVVATKRIPAWKGVVRWGAFGIGTLLWASGIAAMYGDDYKLAVFLYFLGITIVACNFIALDWHNQYPKLKKSIIVVSTVLVATLAFALSIAWIMVRKSDVVKIVSLSPSEVTFYKSAAYTFTVKNNTERDAYTVAIKFAFGMPPSDFKIDSPPGSARPLVPGQTGLRPTDMTGLECRTKKGSYNIYIFVYRLAAGESRELSLTYLGSGDVRVQTRISHFEEVPQPRVTDERGLLTQALVDEDCDPIAGLSLLQ